MRLLREARALALALALSPCAAGEVRAQSTAADLPAALKSVASVRLVGRRHVPSKELWAALKTRRPSSLPWADRAPLRPDFLRADTAAIAAVCRRHGFLDATATVTLSGSGDPREAQVIFRIEEGPRSRIESVEFAGVSGHDENVLRRRIYARRGRPFNPAYLIVDTTRISSAYQERGYIPSVHASFRRDSTRVTVRYDVREGPLYRFGPVNVVTMGEPNVPPQVITRELLVREGEVFRTPRIERSIERLYQTNLFSQVQMSARPDSARALMDMDLRVRERKPRWLDAGVGSGSAERMRATAEWGHRNLGRRALRGTIAGTGALDARAKFLLARAEASIGEPWLFGTRTAGVATIGTERADVREGADRWVIRQTRHTVKFLLSRELGRYSKLGLSQENEFVDQDLDILNSTLPDSVRIPLVESTIPHYTTNRLVLLVDRDLRDVPFNPTRGSIQNFTAQIVRGSSSFRKAELLSSWYTPSQNGVILAAHVRAGVIDPFGGGQFTPGTEDERLARVPISDRFRIGGVNSLRGYEENQIPSEGGLAILQGNLELRVPLLGPLGAEFFVDGGNVWSRYEQIRLADFRPRVSRDPLSPAEVRYVFGFGPRLDLPIGPLRVDVSWNLRPETVRRYLLPRWQFAIGPAF